VAHAYQIVNSPNRQGTIRSDQQIVASRLANGCLDEKWEARSVTPKSQLQCTWTVQPLGPQNTLECISNITGRARTVVVAPRSNAPVELDETIHIWHFFLLEEGIDIFEMGNTTTLCLRRNNAHEIAGNIKIRVVIGIDQRSCVRDRSALRLNHVATRVTLAPIASYPECE